MQQHPRTIPRPSWTLVAFIFFCSTLSHATIHEFRGPHYKVNELTSSSAIGRCDDDRKQIIETLEEYGAPVIESRCRPVVIQGEVRSFQLIFDYDHPRRKIQTFQREWITPAACETTLKQLQENLIALDGTEVFGRCSQIGRTRVQLNFHYLFSPVAGKAFHWRTSEDFARFTKAWECDEFLETLSLGLVGGAAQVLFSYCEKDLSSEDFYPVVNFSTPLGTRLHQIDTKQFEEYFECIDFSGTLSETLNQNSFSAGWSQCTKMDHDRWQAQTFYFDRIFSRIRHYDGRLQDSQIDCESNREQAVRALEKRTKRVLLGSYCNPVQGSDSFRYRILYFDPI